MQPLGLPSFCPLGTLEEVWFALQLYKRRIEKYGIYRTIQK